MKHNPAIAQPGSTSAQTTPARFPFFVLTCIVLLIGTGTLIFLANRNPSPNEKPITTVSKTPSPDEVVETTGAASAPSKATQRIVPRKSRPNDKAGADLEVSADARLLVSSLTQLDLTKGPMSVAAINAWKQNLQRLTAQGAAAVPAIREFLDRNVDLSFDPATGKLLGQSTLRLAMLEAVQNIGGPESTELFSQVLQSTLDPQEIAWLAQSLEQQAPGQYADMAVQAARDALAAAEAGQLADRDVGAVFRVLQQFGGDDALADLEKYAAKYQYYSAISLGNTADGISSLVVMLRDPDVAHGPILQVLAQLAGESQSAADALLDQVGHNQISDSSWKNIAQALCGETLHIGNAPDDSGGRNFHVSGGNQSFYTIADHSQWPPDQVSRAIDISKQLAAAAAAANSRPSAAAAMQNALACLQSRQQ